MSLSSVPANKELPSQVAIKEESINETHCRGVTTSGESAKESRHLAIGLRQQILTLAGHAGFEGITINEAEGLIHDHKGHSISPRFAELIRRGKLVRIPVTPGRPTTRFPHGSPRYITRYDERSRRNVNVHWIPEFAPQQVGVGCEKPEGVQ